MINKSGQTGRTDLERMREHGVYDDAVINIAPDLDADKDDFQAAGFSDVAYVMAQGFVRDGAAQLIGTATASLGRRGLEGLMHIAMNSESAAISGFSAVIPVACAVAAPLVGGYAGYRAGELVGVALKLPDGKRAMMFCKVAGAIAGSAFPLGNALLVPYLKGLHGIPFAGEIVTQLSGSLCRMVGQLARDAVQVGTSKMIGSISAVNQDGSPLSPEQQKIHNWQRFCLALPGYMVGSGAHQAYSKEALAGEVGFLGEASNFLYAPGVGSGISSSLLEAVDALGGVAAHWFATIGRDTELKYTKGTFSVPGKAAFIRQTLNHAAARAAGFGPAEACSSSADATGNEAAQKGLRACAAVFNGFLALRGALINAGLKAEADQLGARMAPIADILAVAPANVELAEVQLPPPVILPGPPTDHRILRNTLEVKVEHNDGRHEIWSVNGTAIVRQPLK